MFDQTTVLIILSIYIAANTFTLYVLFFKSPEYSLVNKSLQFLMIWLIPFLGALIVLMVRDDYRVKNLSIDEMRKRENWKDDNDKNAAA